MYFDSARRRMGIGMLVAGAAILGLVSVGAAATVNLALTPTAKAPKAKGRTQLRLRHSKRRFAVVARQLAPNTSFDVIVGGVKVGAFTTNSSGAGKMKFSTAPRHNDGLLGFDPRGDQVVVREESGDDDLVGDEPSGDPSPGACCLASHEDHGGEAECEELSATDCTTAGGTPNAAASCLPDPCATNPPSNEQIICCIAGENAQGTAVDEDPEVECEDVSTSAECAAQGGVVVEGTSCDSQPCSPTPPASPPAPCCVTHENETECEMLTAESCSAHNGTAATAACDTDPCGASH